MEESEKDAFDLMMAKLNAVMGENTPVLFYTPLSSFLFCFCSPFDPLLYLIHILVVRGGTLAGSLLQEVQQICTGAGHEC